MLSVHGSIAQDDLSLEHSTRMFCPTPYTARVNLNSPVDHDYPVTYRCIESGYDVQCSNVRVVFRTIRRESKTEVTKLKL